MSPGGGLECCEDCAGIHIRSAPLSLTFRSPLLRRLHTRAVQVGAAPPLADGGAFVRLRCALFELTAVVECPGRWDGSNSDSNDNSDGRCSHEFFRWQGVWRMWRGPADPDPPLVDPDPPVERQLTCARCAVASRSVPLRAWRALSADRRRKWMAVTDCQWVHARANWEYGAWLHAVAVPHASVGDDADGGAGAGPLLVAAAVVRLVWAAAMTSAGTATGGMVWLGTR